VRLARLRIDVSAAGEFLRVEGEQLGREQEGALNLKAQADNEDRRQVGAVSSARPTAASASDYGSQPGFDNASACGARHGTFGYLGEQGQRHDLGQGDTSPTGSLKLGADGPATGAANSAPW
jgi:hypothetical protein